MGSATSRRISEYIRENFLDGDPKGDLEDDTPLLEWGVLNSLNTARLIAFIREELDVVVKPVEISAANFRDVRSIAAMVSRGARRAA
ncbi:MULTISPECIES: acyl carrier protein [Streptomyces]|uniref:phosphopantetheine-binding protein n=1 Tax=Streptomyces TaxID=1883 RepID=UPI000B44CBA0|nr:acyl carrier protein [Streptomyces albireticuli]